MDVPDDHDEAAYRAGYAAAWEQIGMLALERAAAVDDDGLTDAEADDAGVCRTCHEATTLQMGADESEHTPEGRVCTDCEL